MTNSSEAGRANLDKLRLRWAIRTALLSLSSGIPLGSSQGLVPMVLEARKAALRRYADRPIEPFHQIARWLLDGQTSYMIGADPSGHVKSEDRWDYVRGLAREEARYIEPANTTYGDLLGYRPNLELYARLGEWPDNIPDRPVDSGFRYFVTDSEAPAAAVQKYFGHRGVHPTIFAWVWAWTKRVERAGGELVLPQWQLTSCLGGTTLWRALVLAIGRGDIKVPAEKRIGTLCALERWAGDQFDLWAEQLMQGLGIDLERVSDSELVELAPHCWSAALKLAERQGRKREPLDIPPVSKRVVEPKWKLESTWCKSYFRTLFTGNFEQDQAIFDKHRGDGVYCRAFFEIYGSTRRVVNEADLFGPEPLLYLHNVVFPKGPPPEPTYAACFAHSQRQAKPPEASPTT